MRLCLCLLLLSTLAWAAPRLLFHSESPFGELRVLEVDGERILEVRDESGKYVEQSRCRVQAPDQLVYDYSRLQTAALLFPERLRSILIVGLGGASLSKALAVALPEATIVSVELDPLVARAARDYFFYAESERVRTVEQDARVFLERNPEQFDLIYLDAFSGLEIPYALRTLEFYQLVRRRLSPGGAVMANLPLESKLYRRDVATLRSVFPQLTAFAGEGQHLVVGTLQKVDPQQNLARWPATLGYSPAPLLARRVPLRYRDVPLIRDRR